jgi:hypothetical protein
MVQPQYSPQEALERVKLMMKYDTSKTLNENRETIKQPLSEAVPLLALIPWLASAAKVGWAALAAGSIGTWIYNTQGGGDSFTKTKSFFEGCSKNIKELKPTVSKSEYRAAADAIYNAIEGFGTTLPVIKSSLESMPTVADLCALNSWYATQYGDLYDDLDSDIDGTDFTKYVWSAIAPKIADAEEDLEQLKDDETPVPEDEKVKEKTGGYTPCKPNQYVYGCKTDVTGAVGQVQECLGLVVDGKFGPKTRAALKAKGVKSFTDADVENICIKTQEQPNDTENPYADYVDDEIETGTADNTGTPNNTDEPIEQ